MKTLIESILGNTEETNKSLSNLVPKAVDLGLPSKTKWADRNVRAKKPEDYGDYIDWNTAKDVKIGKLHCPTLKQIEELYNECKWDRIKINGIEGYKVTGPNGKSIFLPAAGYKDDNERDAKYVNLNGYYWTSSMMYTALAYELYFNSSNRLLFDNIISNCYTMRLVQ